MAQARRARMGVGAAGTAGCQLIVLPAQYVGSAVAAWRRSGHPGLAKTSERAAAVGSLGPGAAEAAGVNSAIAASSDGSAAGRREEKLGAIAAAPVVQLAELGTGSSSAAAAAGALGPGR